jgi:Tol biopolymer transport system component/DNA-binding winged helix-turn-helix (wHTH) protein
MSILRFGVFEVDPDARELRKRGVRVKLQDQPFRVLLALLEKPGEIVTREELKDRLWAQDEFVEFDKSLNTAVQKIRQALGDSAGSPRFLETVPRVGYRFVAAVSDQDAASPSTPERASHKSSYALALAAFAALALAALLWRPWNTAGPPAPPEVLRLTESAGLAFQPAISPDGAFLAYAANDSGNLDIWVKRIPDGAPLRITTHEDDDTQPTFSPDGKTIAFRSERDGGGIYAAPALGGAEPRLLAAEGRRPRYSPDGRRIAYWVGAPHAAVLGNSELYVVNPDGSDRRFLGNGRAPVWSPDGQYLLSSANAKWYIVDPETSERKLVEASETLEAHGLRGNDSILTSPFVADAWLPDGVVFCAYSGEASAVWRAPFSAERGLEGPPERITFGVGRVMTSAASQTGDFVYANTRRNLDIYKLPLDANTGTVAGEPVSIVASARVEWPSSASSDGKLMLYNVARDGGSDLWLYNLSTGTRREVRVNAERISGGRLSPDSTEAAYRVEGERAVYRIPLAGGAPAQVCAGCGYPMDWVPDGSGIAIYGKNGIELLPFDGTQPRGFLVDDQGRITTDAQFSPDGRWVAFHRINVYGEQRQVFVAPYRPEVTLGPADWIEITPEGRNDFRPQWSPDGRSIYFGSEHDGNWCIFAQRVDPDSKQPLGDPLPIYHSHDRRTNLRNTANPGRAALTLVEDGIFFSLAEITGNIWMNVGESRGRLERSRRAE